MPDDERPWDMALAESRKLHLAAKAGDGTLVQSLHVGFGHLDAEDDLVFGARLDLCLHCGVLPHWSGGVLDRSAAS